MSSFSASGPVFHRLPSHASHPTAPSCLIRPTTNLANVAELPTSVRASHLSRCIHPFLLAYCAMVRLVTPPGPFLKLFQHLSHSPTVYFSLFLDQSSHKLNGASIEWRPIPTYSHVSLSSASMCCSASTTSARSGSFSIGRSPGKSSRSRMTSTLAVVRSRSHSGTLTGSTSVSQKYPESGDGSMVYAPSDWTRSSSWSLVPFHHCSVLSVGRYLYKNPC